MLFPEEDAALLKAWIIKRLENTSDADADVLAEYVLALLRHEGTVEEVRALCEAEIPDFLKEDTSVFVNDVFNAIQYRSYLPGGGGLPRPNPAAAAAMPPQGGGLQYDDQPGVSFLGVDPLGGGGGGGQNGSRKRSYHDRGDEQMQDAAEYYPNQPRSFKQARRGRGGAWMDDANGFGRGGYTAAGGAYQAVPTYGAPTPAAGQPPFDPSTFDPNNPMEAMMRLQAMGVPLPRLPPFPQQPPRAKRRQRCRDYDTKGYCARGNSCMFEHGTDSIFVPPVPLPQSPGHEEYDPSTANLPMSRMPLPNPVHSNQFTLDPNFLQQSGRQQPHNGGRIPRHQQQQRRGPKRAAFSAEGPVLDRTKSTIVVENIPEEHFTEDEVRSFFAQYGTILDVSMRPYKHLAIVKYDSWTAANAAYRSPKVIFDNRFVKVFWYKDEDAEQSQSQSTPSKNGAPRSLSHDDTASTSTPVPEIDMEDFLRRQEEAQRAFLEKKEKAAELERQREELERKRKELLAKQQAERQKLYARIAAMSSVKKEENTSTASPSSPSGEGEKKPTPQAEALRAQLAALEAEAKQLGIDPEAGGEEEQPWGGFSYRGGYRGRGTRGGFAPGGRGGFVPRGGGYRGRGGGAPVPGRGGGHAAYAAYSIDNRPKKVALTGVDFTDSERSEGLRQFLFGIGEFTDIRESPSSTTVTFKDRKTAEKFFYGLPNKTIPGVEGTVELSWVVTDQQQQSSTAGSSPGASGANGSVQKADGDKDVAMQMHDHQHEQQQQQGEEQGEREEGEMDYDVAGDDQWDIG